MKIPVLPISYGDAQPLLAGLTGPVAPESWRGALAVTYHLGPGSTNVHMNVVMDNSTRPLYDVIARIPGSDFPDQWILDGNHHDAWVHGASDPLSGAAPLMETARTLAEMTRNGWKPKRTILLAFWDGEEFGLIGSTEWMEKHAEELDRKLVAYINADSTGKGRLNISGSHSLETFACRNSLGTSTIPSRANPLRWRLKRIRTMTFASRPWARVPITRRSSSISASRRSTCGSRRRTPASTIPITTTSTGSAISPTPRSSMGARSRRCMQPLAMLRFADSPLLPFEFGRFVCHPCATPKKSTNLPSRAPKRPDLTALRTEIARLQKTAMDLNAAYDRALPNFASAAPAKLAALNSILFRTERALTADPGLPGRTWYRHLIYAPGVYTGYAAKTLPGIREAVEAGKPDEAREQTARVVQAFFAL